METARTIATRNEQAVPRLVEKCIGVRGSLKISPIYHVKELSPELDVESLRDTLNWNVLEEGEVKIQQSRPHDDVASRIASEIRADQKRLGLIAIGSVEG